MPSPESMLYVQKSNNITIISIYIDLYIFLSWNNEEKIQNTLGNFQIFNSKKYNINMDICIFYKTDWIPSLLTIHIKKIQY